jgi:hypothetical protein
MVVLASIIARTLTIITIVWDNFAIVNVLESSSNCHPAVLTLRVTECGQQIAPAIEGITFVLVKYGMPLLVQALEAIASTRVAV